MYLKSTVGIFRDCKKLSVRTTVLGCVLYVWAYHSRPFNSLLPCTVSALCACVERHVSLQRYLHDAMLERALQIDAICSILARFAATSSLMPRTRL
jgi:hypothetical protein